VVGLIERQPAWESRRATAGKVLGVALMVDAGGDEEGAVGVS